MIPVKELLKERYVNPVKENPESLVGIELELPIVSHAQAVDINVTKGLLSTLSQEDAFSIYERDLDGNVIAIKDRSGDMILFEVSYNTLEIAFAPVKQIAEAEQRFNRYKSLIDNYLEQNGHSLAFYGINPQWSRNDNRPVASPRYQMLMSYLELSSKFPQMHRFPRYGAFICGSQVQLDISKDNYLRVINAFDQIEAAKALLFANSEFDGADWETRISRDLFWEESMHGLVAGNAGLPRTRYGLEDDFMQALEETAMFTVKRGEELYYFIPVPVREYFERQQIKAWNLDGEVVTITPEEGDLEFHRAYLYQSLTTRGTVEFRSVCAQPLDRTFAPAAFHLGLLENLERLESYLETANFFKEFGKDLKALRRQFSKKYLSVRESRVGRAFAKDLLTIAREGLIKRGFGEEVYLDSLD